MKKNYTLGLLLVLMSFLMKAQNCPASIASQSTVTVPHFKIDPGTCNDYPATITIDGSIFNKSSCNGSNLKYTLVSGPPLSSPDTFSADFGFSICDYVNGQLQTLSLPEANPFATTVLYPNPIQQSDILMVNFGTPIDGRMQIFDLTGRLMAQKELLNSQKFSYAIPNIPNGIYLVNIEDGKSSITLKLVVDR